VWPAAVKQAGSSLPHDNDSSHRCSGGQGEPGGGDVGTEPGIIPGAVVAAGAAGAAAAGAGRLAAAGFAAVLGFGAGFLRAAGGGGAGSRAATTGLGLNCVLVTASGSLRGSVGLSNFTGTISGL
jgi:hypothetical protein